MKNLIIKYVILFTTLFLFVVKCSEKEADLDLVDSLITSGEYVQAGEILRNFEMQSYSDTLQIKRINQRIRVIERKKYFDSIDHLIKLKNWPEAREMLDNLKYKIGKMNKDKKLFYSFDYYFRLSIVDSAMIGQEKAVNSMEKALEYPTSEHEILWSIYEKLAFYYAEQNKMVIARENLDKALRKTDLNLIAPGLKKVFSYYMNGEFKKAKQLITEIPDSVKDKHWKTTQLFLKKYGDKLTMEERFKLW